MVEMTSEIVKSTHLPVTVKTRLGWDTDSMYVEEVTERLQDVGVKAISIHGRTRVQMYKGEADWTLIRKIKGNPRIQIPVFGNGDVNSPEKAKEMRDNYGVDGIMIGRASIGYPWIFNEVKHYLATGEYLAPPTIDQRVDTCLKHFEFSLKWKGEKLGNVEMRRHYSNYFKGFHGFKPFRMRLVTTNENSEIFETLEEIRAYYANMKMAVA
jgi:nifR3 family TIM-barrel protein